jgi:glutamyl-tRNA reductase
MTLTVLGVNHKTAPIELRERIAISRDELSEVTRALASVPGVAECMILSTCNRVELIAIVESAATDLSAFLTTQFGVELPVLASHLYLHRDRQAVNHVFRVASSLDSMVVGEPQILGQVKEAYTVARSAGTVGSELEHLMQSAFSAAKRVRTETEIGSSSVSIASVAVDLARKIFGSLHGRTVFLVGAGKMSELAARHLIQQGAGTILVTNRTMERAQRMAEPFNGRVIPFEQLYDRAAEADIVITSTGAPHHIFRPEHGRAFLHARKNRPMFFIDIAVPRDVDPAANNVEGIFVYDIDDLQQVAAAHIAERNRSAGDADALIQSEVERFHQRRRAVNVAPAIVALQRQAEELRQVELRRIHPRLGPLTPEQTAAVEALTRGLVNKFLHPPMQALKQAARENDPARVDALCEAWSLPVVSAGQEPASDSEPVQKKVKEASEPPATANLAGRR